MVGNLFTALLLPLLLLCLASMLQPANALVEPCGRQSPNQSRNPFPPRLQPVVKTRFSCGMRPHFLLQALNQFVLCLNKLIARLQIQPELSFHPKKPTETKRRICCDRSLPVNNLTYTALGNADVFSEAILGDAHRVKKLLQEDLSRMNGGEISLTHDLHLRMVIDNFYIKSITVAPNKANTPLIIDSYAVLACSFSFQLLKPSRWWNP